jgi:DNA-directed RNA polymerase subunit beta
MKVQKHSYDEFLQPNLASEERKNQGLESVLRSIFQIENPDTGVRLEYVSYSVGEPKYEPEESIKRGVNYSASLTVRLRLITWDREECEEMEIKEQEVPLTDVPLMTDSGTFIINGAQRVVVSQLHRSPGVFYANDEGKTLTSSKLLYSARVIPYRGSWLDLEFNRKDFLYFRIDRKKKKYVTVLLRALGMSASDILKTFYQSECYNINGEDVVVSFNAIKFRGAMLDNDIVDIGSGEVLIKKGQRVSSRLVKQLISEKVGCSYLSSITELYGKFVSEDVVGQGGEIILEAGEEINQNILDKIRQAGVRSIRVIIINNVDVGSYIRDTLAKDKQDTLKGRYSKYEALSEIYEVIRPGRPAISEEQFLRSIFFDAQKYDLSFAGRRNINHRLKLDTQSSITVLEEKDIISVINQLLLLKCGIGDVDDIDSLSNRRVRANGELIENVFRTSLSKIQKSIVERLSLADVETVTLNELVQTKVLTSGIRDFFGMSPLSQFMDQINPLAAITHKRRLSALGPGGLTRDRAGFEVRDVHVSHYSRICPIETPEGSNIGLISSMATYADIDKYGFIQSPYRKVKNSIITDEVVNLTAAEEEFHNIVNATIEIDSNNKIKHDIVSCHRKGELTKVYKEEVTFADVSPQQLVSVAASLIPFLENDDANRALMGSNMMRQAVPVIGHEAPLVGTGMESIVSRNSGTVVVAKRSGTVDYVDSQRVVVKAYDDSDVVGIDIYNMIKFDKSNQGTCINQQPVIDQGDKVKKGDILADGVATDKGELALGKNILAAFLPWNGYNFEDSILLSERLVKEDVFTSIHIKEYEVLTRDTRLGPEEITRDLPNVSDNDLKNLDEVGIVNIGSIVKAGDILVGKVTPKSESPLTAEEKLLRAIFGEKSTDVMNCSLRLSPGEEGVVVDVKIFTKRGVAKDQRALSNESCEIDLLMNDRNDKIRLTKDYIFQKIQGLLLNKKLSKDFMKLKANHVLKETDISELYDKRIFNIELTNASINTEINKLAKFYEEFIENLKTEYNKRVNKLQSGHDLQQGVLKSVKVYVASKLKIQIGDKMAGRHGNKGVISRIVPIEEMPYLDDGTPIDMVLNPSGVPSRMNIGQIFEIHLGWAAKNIGDQIARHIQGTKKTKLESCDSKKLKSFVMGFLPENCKDREKIETFLSSFNNKEAFNLSNDLAQGIKFATPVFDGAKEEDINNLLKKSGLDSSGQVLLRDGKTGEYFDRKVTVGVMYMLKLDHLVDNKIHARSIGPYSLVTQQPLGGRSHFGGQRLGEMECWALQAYGAAYTLREMLTIKSDDVNGRVRAYESIIRGENSFDVFLPESFKVMIQEIKSLGLNIETLEEN